MRIKEIEARLAAIKQEIEQRGDAMTAAEIDALEQETTQLTEERAGLIAAAEKRNGILDNIAKGAGVVSRSFQQNNGDGDTAPDDPFGTPEYRSAWLKNIRRLPLNDAEKRAFSNASGAGAEVIPTQTANEIISKVKTLAPMLNEVTLLHVKGAVKFAIEGTNNAAAIHTENASITAAADTLTTVSLSGYEIVKLVQISDTVMTMSITAFESWIVNMLAEAIARKVEDLLINGTGSSQPKGIENAITLGATQTLSVSGNTFTALTNAQHTITITATDSAGNSAVRTLTFTKSIAGFVITLSAPLEANSQPTRANIKVTRDIPAGGTFKVEATNNPFDASPVWEDCTNAVVQGVAHVFTNKINTAAQYGMNIRVTVQRGDALTACWVSGIGGNFE